MNDLGVVWNPRDNRWGLRVNQLEKHFKKYGHFRVNQKDEEFKVLYSWLYKIKKKGTSIERIHDLRNIGFPTENINIIHEN